MVQPSARQAFTAALETLAAQLRQDRSVLAVILCGSLSHDTVWEKSDIDLVLVTIDDPKVAAGAISLFADGLNVHAFLVPRSGFRRMVEGSVQNSFIHSLLAKGRLVYTHDDSIARLCEGLRDLGARDREIQLLRAATAALAPLYKARKWFVTREDLDYAALWLLYAASPLAEIEVISAGLIADREVLPQAMRLNPGLFRTIYADLLNQPKTRQSVAAALEAAETCLAARTSALFAPVLDYLRDAGDARSCSDLDAHFSRHYDVPHVTTACEYLADQGLIGKVSTTARITKKSGVAVQELAFVHLGARPDGEWDPR